MDQATLSALMKSFGAADTPENSNRIRSHYAANPDEAERRLFGGGNQGSVGGRDDLLNAMLDKFVAQTDGPSGIAPNTEPPPQSLPMVQNANGASRRSATAGAPQRPPVTDWAGMNENPNLGPLPARNASVGEAAAVPNDGMGLLDLIGLLIGGGATANIFRSPSANAQANGRGAGAGGMNSANRRAIAAPVDAANAMIDGPDPNMKRLTYEPKLVAPETAPIQSIDESRRPVNTNADERNSEGKNKPINIDTKPQQQGPYDGKPMNVQDQMLEQANRKMPNARRIATGRIAR